MNATIYAFTAQGIATARRVRACLGGGAMIAVPGRMAGDDCASYG